MVISLIIYYVFLYFDINMLTSAILFVFPVGGLIFGLIIGYLAKTGLRVDNVSCTKRHIILLCLICVVFIGILTAIDYMSCYVIESGELNRAFNGYHIGNYTLDGKQIDFIEYLKLNYLSAEMSISWKGNRSNPINIGKTGFVFVIYVLQYIAISITSALMVYSVNEIPKCDNCGQYYKETEIERYLEEQNTDEVVQKLYSVLNTGNEFKAVNLRQVHYRYVVKANYCGKCKTGMIVVYKHLGRGRNDRLIPEASYEINQTHMEQLGLLNRFVSHHVRDKGKHDTTIHNEVNENTADQLRIIKKLFDEGVITKEEFDAKKKSILNL